MKWLSYLLILLVSVSCVTKEAEPIKLNSDACEFCKMKISDGKFGAELITNKGRIYKFDDLNCMIAFNKSNEKIKMNQHFVNDYEANNQLIDATTAWFIKHETIKSPMGSNTAAFSKKELAENKAKSVYAEVLSWDQLKY